MIIKATIECESINDLIGHLQEIQEQVKVYVKKNKLNRLEDELPEGVIFEDNNCYGTHHLEVVSDEAENPFWLAGGELEKAIEQAKQY